jgi:hypothetical protein
LNIAHARVEQAAVVQAFQSRTPRPSNREVSVGTSPLESGKPGAHQSLPSRDEAALTAGAPVSPPTG